MKRLLHFSVRVALVSLLCITTNARADGVTVNGTFISGAEPRIDETVEVVALRDGITGVTHLEPGSKNYGIGVATRRSIALFDAQLPVGATGSRFTLVFDAGRTFYRCLVTGLKYPSDEDKFVRRLLYTLRCEDTSS